MNFQEKLKEIRELAGLDENVKSILKQMTGKELVSYEGIDALVAALMGFYNAELKKKAPSSHTHGWGDVTGKPGSFPPSSHTHDDRYYTESEINEKFKNFCPFPVNSLYLSLGSENPSSLWLGTTWQKQENRFLLGAGSSYGLGSTGGNSSISLSASNMPSHRHKVDSTSASIAAHTHQYYIGGGSHGGSGNTEGYVGGSAYRGTTLAAGGGTTGSFAPYTDYQGNGSAFSIMPPYIAVNIWKRTS